MLTEPKITITEATIESTEKQSSAVEILGAKHLGLIIPAAWATAAMTFLVSHNGTDYVALYDDKGAEVTTTVAVSTGIGLATYEASFAPWQFLKLRSGTAASEVAQPGPKASIVLTPETLKTLTITSGVGDVASNDLTFKITVAVNDTLALSKSGNDVTIAIANATGSKNSAANIQIALQALSTVGAVDVSSATVAGNTAYDNEPITGSLVGDPAECELDFGDDKTLTINSVLAGSNYNDLTFKAVVAVNDTLAVAESGGTVTISLANTTEAKNADTAIETAVQALSVSGYDMTAFTVTGSTEYDAAEPIGSTVGTVAELVLDFEDSKTLTITPGFSGDLYHDLSIAVDTAANDTLAVAESEGVITISLADTTPGNNTAAAIQTALRGMTVTGYNMLGVTVAESAEYAAARPVDATIAAVDFAGGVDFEESAALTGGDEVVVAATNLAGGDITRIQVVAKG